MVNQPEVQGARRSLSQRGLRTTTPRLEIMQALGEVDAHISADQLYQFLQARGRRISRATVYRTLARLEAAGLARRVPITGGAARYELVSDSSPAPSRLHAHFICRGCGLIVDLPVRAGWESYLDLSACGNVTVREVNVIGFCSRCRQLPELDDRGSWSGPPVAAREALGNPAAPPRYAASPGVNEENEEDEPSRIGEFRR